MCKNCAERAELNQEDFWPAQVGLTFATRLLVGIEPQHAAAVARASDMESTMRICKAEVRHPTSMVRLVLVWLVSTNLLSGGQTVDFGSCQADKNNTSASPTYVGTSANATPGSVSKLPIRSLLYDGSQTRIYTRYMPWFGDTHHLDVGYRSNDQQQIARQVADMMSRGIQGAIVDWYGPHSGFKNENTILLMKEAERQNFEFAISEDAGALAGCKQSVCDPTEYLIADLRYAAEHFESSPAYVHIDRRPAVFFFGLERYSIDWDRVRHSLRERPLLFFRNSGSLSDPNADGAYAWIAPETIGPTDPMGLQYLERFYSKAQKSSKIVMGSAYKGFDDSKASWGQGRVIKQECGETWLSTFTEASHFYSSNHQLPALIIPTWNDYEEGTEIETGIDNCVRIQARLNSEDLSWTVVGPEKTIDHYAVLAERGSEWIEAASIPATTHSLALHELNLRGKWTAVCVESVGKASILNHFSRRIQIPDSNP